MFRAWCAAESADVLLTTRRITDARRIDGRLEIAFTCWCGHAGHTVDPLPRPTTGPALPPVPVPA